MRLALQHMEIAESSAYGRKGSAATHRSQVKDQCPKCGLWFKNLVRHEPYCHPVAPKPPKGHAKCVECGRLVKIGARLCFHCSGDAAAVAAAMEGR